MDIRIYYNSGEALTYLDERLPYDISRRTFADVLRTIRYEQKLGGGRKYYSKEALDAFIAEDEARRDEEHATRLANAQAAKENNVRRTVHKTRSSGEDCAAQIKQIFGG